MRGALFVFILISRATFKISDGGQKFGEAVASSRPESPGFVCKIRRPARGISVAFSALNAPTSFPHRTCARPLSGPLAARAKGYDFREAADSERLRPALARRRKNSPRPDLEGEPTCVRGKAASSFLRGCSRRRSVSP